MTLRHDLNVANRLGVVVEVVLAVDLGRDPDVKFDLKFEGVLAVEIDEGDVELL